MISVCPAFALFLQLYRDLIDLFCRQIILICCLCACRLLPVPLPRFEQLLLAVFSFFLGSYSLLSPSHATFCFFSLLQLLLVFFARGITVYVFATPNNCLHRFVLARLAFFCYCLQIFGFNFCNICIAALCVPKLRTIPPLCPLWPPQPSLQNTWFFSREHDSENMSCLLIFNSFCLVFSLPRVYEPHCTHPCASVPICTHS